jgi:hypothetical protein
MCSHSDSFTISFVSRDVVPNKSEEYNKLSKLLKEGRMGGIVDWDAIEDRLRVPKKPSSFNSPKEILEVATKQFALPRMDGQTTYIEVWVEKDALSGVLSRVTQPYHIPILVNRGYSSASAMHDAYERFEDAIKKSAKKIKILYLGDFDPSGVDMLRDIEERICEFFLGKRGGFEKWMVTSERPNGKKKKRSCSYHPDLWRQICKEKYGIDFEIISIALTQEQIQEHEPPPNPAKITDPRHAKFSIEHGDTSWEVDALPPEVLNQILTDSIENNIDRAVYDKILENEEKGRKKLTALHKYLK